MWLKLVKHLYCVIYTCFVSTGVMCIMEGHRCYIKKNYAAGKGDLVYTKRICTQLIFLLCF